MGCAFFYVSSTNHGFVRKNMKIMGLVPILKKQAKIYHTKFDLSRASAATFKIALGYQRKNNPLRRNVN